ncbi:Spy/CpxP family protein refolding chaperone [candidate division KSB1 bacterium]
MKHISIVISILILFIGTACIAQDAAEKTDQEQTALRLTQEQREKIQQLRLDFQKEQVQLQADKRIAELDLQKIMQDANTSESALRDQMEKVAGFDISLKLSERNLRTAVNEVLTPEQRQVRNLLRDETRPLTGRQLNRSMRPAQRVPDRQGRLTRPDRRSRRGVRRDVVPDLRLNRGMIRQQRLIRPGIRGLRPGGLIRE